jgi:2'-5' RNA ligase
MTEPAPHRRRRLFFALVPDGRTRKAILTATREAVRAARGRATAPPNLHVTVAFLGNIDASRVDAARAAVPEATAFELALGRLARRHAMLWLEPLAVPEPLATLERALWERLAALGFEREQRAYRPHFTLARNVREPAEGTIDVVWPVHTLHLMESVGGAKGHEYVSIGTWPLADPAP